LQITCERETTTLSRWRMRNFSRSWKQDYLFERHVDDQRNLLVHCVSERVCRTSVSLVGYMAKDVDDETVPTPVTPPSCQLAESMIEDPPGGGPWRLDLVTFGFSRSRVVGIEVNILLGHLRLGTGLWPRCKQSDYCDQGRERRAGR
jgi:hypothetical protein